jgi:hypothetical protein
MTTNHLNICMKDDEIKNIKDQAALWNKLSLVVPILFAAFAGLLLVAMAAWVVTAIVWWWWTMRTVIYIAKILHLRTADLAEIKKEIQRIRDDIT